MCSRKSILVLILLKIQLISFGQVLNMEFTDPLKDKSLTSDFASCVVQDTMGFIWIGTNDGLNCYDGYRINQYRFDANDSASLVNNTVNRLFLDSSGRLWVGAMLGLCRYNSEYDNFTWIASEDNYAGLESLQISSISQDSKGRIYVAAGRTIYRLMSGENTFEIVYKAESGQVNEFIFGRGDVLWIGASDDGGLIRFDLSEKKSERFLSSEGKNSLTNNTIRDLALLGNQLWIGTYGGGVDRLDLDTYTFKNYPPPDEYAGYTTYTYIDNDKNLWTCDHTGIKMYDRQNDSFHGYYTVESDENTIKSSAVAIYQDRQGNYWTIHAPGGVCLRAVPKGFLRYDKNPADHWHTANNVISSVEIDSKGNWWIGNGFNGIDVFDWEKNRVRSYLYDASDPFSLGKGAVLCLFRDKGQAMWVGTYLGGLQYYNEAEDRFHSFTHNPEDTNSIACNDIRSVAEDGEGNLWVVTHGKGIDRFNPAEGIFRHYTNAMNNLANDWAFQVIFDSSGNLWAATAWGLSKLAKGSDSFQSYFNLPDDTSSISHNQVNCLFEDSSRQIWVGTSDGLNKYNPESDDFTRYNTGFASNIIYAIQEGGGYIWVSTTKGLSRFNPEKNEVYNFSYKDGLPEGEFMPRSVAKNSENAIFFGSGKGLAVFDPGQLKFNTGAPEILLTGLYINSEPINTYGGESILKKNICYTREIVLAHNQNSITFEFAAINYIHPERNEYRYKLEPVDKKWVSLGNENTVNFSHLKTGRYTFRVTGANNDDVWNETGASLKIRVTPPWWFSWWCELIIGICCIALLFLIYHLRTASLHKRNEWLAQKVEERTKALFSKNKLLKKSSEELKNTNIILKKRQEIIEKQSEELKQQAEELKVIADNLEATNKELIKTNDTKDKLFSIIGHDLKNPFNIILGYTDILIDSFREFNENQVQELLVSVKESSASAYNLLDNLLNWARSQSGELEFFPEKILISDLIESITPEIMPFSRKKGIEILTDFDNDINLRADINMLTLTCRNLLMNSVKFSNPGNSINFEIKKQDSKHALFSVKDQGIGIPEEKVKTLFNSDFYIKSSQGTAGEKGTGLGLVLCKEFITRHSGTIWVESKVSSGTTFYFTIPLAENYQS